MREAKNALFSSSVQAAGPISFSVLGSVLWVILAELRSAGESVAVVSRMASIMISPGVFELIN